MLRAGTDERRDAKRNRMLKGGVIAFSARHATIPCVLRDLSDGGARLQVAQSSAIPDTFELIVELDGLEVPCQVIWRKVTEIGVEFLAKPTLVNPKRVQVIGQTGPLARATLRRGNSHPPVAQAPAPVAPAPASAPRRPFAGPASEPGLAVPEAATPAVQPAIAARPPKAGSSGRGPIPILIAEDDPDDRLLLSDAFMESDFEHPIDFVENGEELLKYVRGQAPYEGRTLPGLILLDLNMPRMDGRTALMHLKTDSCFKRIPVIVLTTSNAEDDIHRTYELGVTAYVAKPSTHDGLLHLIQSLNGFWGRFVSLPPS